MSQKNVEVIARSYEAFGRGDLDGALAGLDPDIEWRQPVGIPDVPTYRGHQGVRQLLSDLLDSFDRLRVEPQEFIDAGDKVVVAVRQSGRGKASGADVDAVLYQVAPMRAGKVVAIDVFLDRADALAAAGVRPESL